MLGLCRLLLCLAAPVSSGGASGGPDAEKLATVCVPVVGKAPKFVNSLFWLCARGLHVGLLPAWRHYAQLVTTLANQPSATAPGNAGGGDVAFLQMQKTFSEKSVECADVHLLDPEAIASVGAFYAAAAQWLGALLDRREAEAESKATWAGGEGLASTSEEFANVPLFLVENIAEWLTQFAPAALAEGTCKRSVDAIIALGMR
ncbi:hypothetical protein T492DRAFT_877104 [Pavlovales sp. CCMP2436]|nr:hypothetical protein T492DRAFT_877104 [Pavlovales sp. CCMP2436]